MPGIFFVCMGYVELEAQGGAFFPGDTLSASSSPTCFPRYLPFYLPHRLLYHYDGR